MLRAITAVVLAAYLLGFLLFASGLPRAPADLHPVQGVVALTGGHMRIDTAYRLFCYDNIGERLLISGVYPENRREAFFARLKTIDDAYPPDRRKDCEDRRSAIDLGYAAENTRGNAREAAAWARFYKLDTLLIVTARYHMPRSLTEFREAMPKNRIVAYPIDPDGIPQSWWLDVRAIRLLHTEYAKYLVASVLSVLGLEPKDLDAE